jgi:hypothetical protein
MDWSDGETVDGIREGVGQISCCHLGSFVDERLESKLRACSSSRLLEMHVFLSTLR